MPTKISSTLLSQVSEFITERMGLHFPKERWRDLERGIESATAELGFQDAESCLQSLVSSALTKGQVEILARHLTVGETYFFRDERSFEILEQRVLPELIFTRRGSNQRLRIWSAGCCSGEEAYSIAILLRKVIPELKDWNITILATDINSQALRKASEGVYTEWSFRTTSEKLKQNYFKPTKDGRWALPQSIREMVTLQCLNLAEDVYPSLWSNTNAMDVIFCRNVLMYLSPEAARKVVHRLYQCLMDGGWLFVSPSEVSQSLFSQFSAMNFPGAIVYQKEAHRFLSAENDFHSSFSQAIPSLPPIADAIPPNPVSEVLKFEALPEPVASDAEVRDGEEQSSTSLGETLALYEQGDYEEAASRLLVLSQSGEDAKVMSLLARVFANRGKLAEALGWCEKAIAAEKTNPEYHYLLATILQEQGALAEALSSLKRTLYLDQDFVLAHFALGNLTLRGARLEESDKHFKNALSLLRAYRPDDILPHSEGMTAGRLMEIIDVQRDQSVLATE